MANNDETKSLQDANPKKNVNSNSSPTMSLADRNREAALKRAEEKEANQKALEEAWEKERKNDGRQYELEVEGFNIGDSLHRRMSFLAEKAAEAQDEIAEEDLEKEIEGDEPTTEEVVSEEPVSTTEDELDEIENSDDEDDIFGDNEEDEDITLDDLDDEEEEPVEEPVETPVEEVKPEVKETPAQPVANTEEETPENVVPLSQRPLPEQHETKIDDEDLADLDLDDEDTTTDDSDSSGVSEEELEALKKEINAKIGAVLPTEESITVVDKPVSVKQFLNSDAVKGTVADWPLMTAGNVVSMSTFSGPDIEVLSQNTNSRNRTNSFREIYQMLYDHIVSPKPKSFEQWLKETSFMDLEHYYMAAYRASFSGANYIPINCTNDDCDKVFLTDNVDMIESQVKFKDDEAKKRFFEILNSDVQVPPKAKTKLKVLSSTIAVVLREPSIYNTIFENSVLDQKFIRKYDRLLTMMVYLDQILLIGPSGQARPVKVKQDPHSIAKSAKYRIATFAQIINKLPSDAYAVLLSEINKMSQGGDEVTYQFPEVTCPHCGHTIEAQDTSAQALLFSRHRLNLLTQQ